MLGQTLADAQHAGRDLAQAPNRLGLRWLCRKHRLFSFHSGFPNPRQVIARKKKHAKSKTENKAGLFETCTDTGVMLLGTARF
jgi:hypothetical protein